jgi:hypothetical protein
MTASTQGLTAQGLAGSGILPQQGTVTPGFPSPIGAEQYLGTTQQYGFPQQHWYPYPQQQGFPQQHEFPQQQGFPQQGQQVSQLVGQILPIAQQMILPQVIALAAQQIQQHVQQLVTQLAVPQLTGQQQPMWPGAGQFTRPYPMFS